MIGHPKLKTLQELIDNSTQEELIWMNGYLAGLIKFGVSATTHVKHAIGKLTIVFGTDTGNSKKLATDFASKIKKGGGQVKLQSLDQYRLSDLLKEEYFLVVISTHGDGEPPLAAKPFYDYLHQNDLKLDKLKYAVLGLGDSAYPLFCKVGEDIDTKLQMLGASRIIPLQKCDVDYEENANSWFDTILKALQAKSNGHLHESIPVVSKKFSRKNLVGKVLTNINLNGRGSFKETHHIELTAPDVSYQPGDSIGIVPENPPAIVDAVLQLLDIDKNKTLPYKDNDVTVGDLLRKKLNIVFISERVVNKYALLVKQEIPSTRIDLFNLLKIYPLKKASQFAEVITILEPITPRLYSISSSLAAYQDEIHITVARNCFTINGEVKHGQCSNYLSSLPVDSLLEFYVHKNSQFKLPDNSKDIIMIGPGTGFAPFRSFLEERDSTGASGRNWLFFGEQHFESDFLYQTEIQNLFQTGILTHIDVAFSRDQAEKIYVQHKMVSQGQEFFNWIEAGAYVYVCGAKDPMSVDVENALIKIIEQFGNMTSGQAQEYVLQMKQEDRYQKDVY